MTGLGAAGIAALTTVTAAGGGCSGICGSCGVACLSAAGMLTSAGYVLALRSRKNLSKRDDVDGKASSDEPL
ncbi:hypothetical protein [Heliophilum fasciatum]|uniref:hypothetical protein n=1 Tax=Heliophilum fasciatum TaxID=35700 RepID=UPI0010428C72|nr:hypothetical protein [Heliophilum fasciatum]MCW2276605.1 hypothetical protein [Heliophilum fasciatum]